MTDKNLVDVVIKCLDNNGVKSRAGTLRPYGDDFDSQYERPTVSRGVDHVDELISYAVQHNRDDYELVIVAVTPIATPCTIKFNIRYHWEKI